jgi:hypothetical protein
MNWLRAAFLLGVLGAVILCGFACDWNVPSEDTEKEKEADCSRNPGYPGYDCADACCGWDSCGPPALYEDYEDCTSSCDDALYIDIIDEPEWSEGYKNCVLDCVASCTKNEECSRDCLALFRD